MSEINFTQCAVAFLDILGFKDFITAAETTNSKEFTHFCQLLDVIDRQLDFYADNSEQHLSPET
jgi:hypothetical protein